MHTSPPKLTKCSLVFPVMLAFVPRLKTFLSIILKTFNTALSFKSDRLQESIDLRSYINTLSAIEFATGCSVSPLTLYAMPAYTVQCILGYQNLNYPNP